MFDMQSIIFLGILIVGDYYYLNWLIFGKYQNSELASLYFLGLILFLINGLIAWGISHSLIAHRKGKLKIKLEDKIYEPGKKLVGSIIVNLNMALDVENLAAELSAKSTRRDNERTYSDVVWKREVQLLGASHLPAGVREFEFSFDIPSRTKEDDDSHISKIFDFVINGEISWSLTARLSTPGVDLSDERVVLINGDSIF